MPTYAAAAIGAVVISTAVLLPVFGRLRLLNVFTLFAAAAAAIISVAAFPLLFGLITRIRGGAPDASALMQTTVLATVSCLVFMFLSGILITLWAPKTAGASAQAGNELPEAVNQAAAAGNENYLEQIYDKLMHENGKETLKNEENTDNAINYLEKSVDSSENIDKMGIENSVRNSAVMSIEDCIGEAFECKEAGNAEDAVRFFMDALDKNPSRELTFWIVLNICVLYKDLGQVDLAYDILNSYYDTFGDVMDASVKEEIESNLFDIQA